MSIKSFEKGSYYQRLIAAKFCPADAKEMAVAIMNPDPWMTFSPIYQSLLFRTEALREFAHAVKMMLRCLEAYWKHYDENEEMMERSWSAWEKWRARVEQLIGRVFP